MKAVIAHVPESFLALRKGTGTDRWDEVWEGVLHMPPAPNRHHQDLLDGLKTWLELYWAGPKGGRVHREVNLASPGGWPNKDYRIPDLVLLTAERFGIDHNEYFEGAPTVAVEIHSPGDETFDKFDFYARMGVPEIWIIHRDTKMPHLYVLEEDGYQQQQPGNEGWARSPSTRILMRASSDDKLEIQREDDPATRRAIRDARSAF